MATTPASPASPASINTNPNASSASSADELTRQLRSAMQSLNRREPLDPTYKHLLQSGTLTHKHAVVPKDKFYKRIGSKLRERVERYMQEMQGKGPFDRISQRQKLEEASMRAAFTLREAKEHEQLPLLEATLAAHQMHPERKRALDGIALWLQTRKEKKIKLHSPPNMEHTEQARHKAELERQRAQARKWEEARRRREEDERRRKEEEILIRRQQDKPDTPQQKVYKIIEPVFRKLWDMEFVNLGGTNPFRIVIDRDNCASIGAPDYFDVIKIPMNLTYIQEKVNKMQYPTLQAFFSDVDLMINNAILYNSDPDNPYRIAAEEMKKRFDKHKNKIFQIIHQQRQQAQNK